MNTHDEMSKSGSVLEPNTDADARERLILALLQEPRLDKAARAAGIPLSVVCRLRRTPEFEREFRKAANAVFANTVSHLQSAMEIAVATLIGIMRGPTTRTGDRLRACEMVLAHATVSRMDELDALFEHVEMLREENRRRRRNGT